MGVNNDFFFNFQVLLLIENDTEKGLFMIPRVEVFDYFLVYSASRGSDQVIWVLLVISVTFVLIYKPIFFL